MKTLRHLAAALATLGLVVLTPTASAQLERKGLAPTVAADPSSPAKPAPPAYTADQLEKVLKAGFDKVEATGEGNARGFALPKLQYRTKSGEKVEWTVSVDLAKRASGPGGVRLFFPCQTMPADPNPARLQQLMEASGSFKESGAYFLIGGKGENRMLYLVTEVPTDTLDASRMQDAVEGLLVAADASTPLWGAKLTDPPAKEGKTK